MFQGFWNSYDRGSGNLYIEQMFFFSGLDLYPIGIDEEHSGVT